MEVSFESSLDGGEDDHNDTTTIGGIPFPMTTTTANAAAVTAVSTKSSSRKSSVTKKTFNRPTKEQGTCRVCEYQCCVRVCGSKFVELYVSQLFKLYCLLNSILYATLSIHTQTARHLQEKGGEGIRKRYILYTIADVLLK